MVKASDIRSLFGHVTQGSPVYRHSAVARNIPVRGAAADSLKFSPSICKHCNNARTQPHDRAWEKLSEALRGAIPPLKRGDRFPLQDVFGGGVSSDMLAVHHYFLKLFGCYAVEHAAPLPLNAFAVAILAGRPHPNVFLTFVAINSNAGRKELQVGPVQGIEVRGVLTAATWFYVIGTVGVLVAYSEGGRPGRGFSWHPEDQVNSLPLA